MSEKAFTEEQSVQIICALINSSPLAENFPEFGATQGVEEMSRDVFSGLFATQLRELHAALTEPVECVEDSPSVD